MEVRHHENDDPASPEMPAGDEIEKWAWVELNYRPHAYQAI
jgi:hypothetical protein